MAHRIVIGESMQQTPQVQEATLMDYVETHISAEPEYLSRLYRATNVHLLRPRMASGHLQGRLLKMLVQMSGAKNIVEIGTFSGYATLCMAEGLSDDGVIHTFEINDEQEDFTRPWIEGQYDHCGFPDEAFGKIRMHIGDAMQLLPGMGLTFDFAFVDGDKRTYIECYEMLLPMMCSGGMILADNTLWDGHVVEEAPKERMTQGIMAFNDYVKNDPRVEVVMLPLRDGLTLIRVR